MVLIIFVYMFAGGLVFVVLPFAIRDRSLIIRQGGLEEKEQKWCKFSMTHPIKVLIFS
jgi:hypothetical protein